MASTASGRGRPAILDKADLDLGNGTNATIRLVGEGDTVQIELPLSWSLDALQRSATRSGGRTKVTFTFDAEPDADADASASASTNGDATAETKRVRVTKKVAAADEPVAETNGDTAPATKKTPARRAPRKKAEVAA